MDAVYDACVDGDLKRLKKLPIANVDCALVWACKFGKLRIVKWLVRQGAHIRRLPPIVKACKFGHLKLVKFLLEGTEHLWRDGTDKYIFEIACTYGHLNVVKFLHKRGFGGNLIGMELAGASGRLRIVKWIHSRDKEAIPMSIAKGMYTCRQYDILEWIERVQPEHRWLLNNTRRPQQLVSFFS
jgi:ankyrin repeat protein